jgi:hypothetical protein
LTHGGLAAGPYHDRRPRVALAAGVTTVSDLDHDLDST